MPARSKSQQRLFGMVHAYQKGNLKNVPEEVKDIARSISSEDAEHFAKTKHKGLPEKKADIDLKDGKYDDVKTVYDGLTDKEKNFVTPGRSVYKDVPKYLAGRTVAYNGETPVGFSDIYGYNNDGSLRASPNICLAVSGEARGKNLASIMTKDVMHKVLARAKELRKEKGARADKIKRFVWMILKENDSSARAAIHSGFKEVPYRDGSQRKFIMSRRDAEKRAFFENKDNKKRWLGNMAVLSTAATPFLISSLFKGRGAKLSALAEKAISNPAARKITLRDAAKAAYKEKLQWDKAGYKFNNMRIAEQNIPGFADLSHFEFNPFTREGGMRIGVKSLADAHRTGINSDMFFHELGHAHEAYKHNPKTVLGNLWQNYIAGNIIPAKWNPVFKEEVRAWENANKLSGGLINKDTVNAALNTYKNDIYRRNAVALSGIGSAALIGNRFLGEK